MKGPRNERLTTPETTAGTPSMRTGLPITSGSPPNVFIQNVCPSTTCTGEPDGSENNFPVVGVTPRPPKKLLLTQTIQNCDARPSAESPVMRGITATTELKGSARSCRSFSC